MYVKCLRLIIGVPLHSYALDYLISKFLLKCYVYLVRMGLGCINEDMFQHLWAVTHWVLAMCELSFCYQLNFLFPLFLLFPGVFPFRFGLFLLLLPNLSRLSQTIKFMERMFVHFGGYPMCYLVLGFHDSLMTFGQNVYRLISNNCF